MKLSESTAVIRPRRGWEAIDLGIRMVQRDFRPLARRWIIATLPWFALSIYLGSLAGDISIGILIFWWLKPAFDRVLLDYLSERLFSPQVEDPGPMDLWFKLPFSASAWRQLTYLRFSLVRSFSLPVYQLERGGDSGSRIRTLVSRDYGASAWLTLVFHTLSSLMLIVVISQLASWLHPSPVVLQDADLWETLFNSGELFSGTLFWLHLAFFYVVTGLFELFFVGAGFAMYLNRRTHLEAWDIELSFRRLAQRLGQGTVQLLLVGCLAGLTLQAPRSDAQPVETPGASMDVSTGAIDTDSGLALPPADEARAVVNDIHSGDEFGERITGREWREKGDQVEDAEPDGNVFDQVGPFVTILASVIKYLIVGIVVILLAIWLIRERRRLLAIKRRNSRRSVRASVDTPDEPEAFVPDADVPNVVSTLWDEGRYRESLSYLYRSALAYLTTRHQLVIGDHATEEDCLRLVRASASDEVSRYFSDITRQWRLLAYGNRQPSDDAVEALCARWAQLSPASGATTEGPPRA